MNTETIGKCWRCGAALEVHDYGRENNCLSCGKPTRVCRNCRWYDPARTNECREPVAERVMDKTRANYCEFFEAGADSSGDASGSPEDELRTAAESLFKS